MRFLVIMAGLAFATASSAEDAPGKINLICGGGGSANQVASATVNSWDSDSGHGSAQVLGTRSVGFDDQVSLWIDGDEGRLRMPRAMLPALRGGEDGWFKLKSIKFKENEITGSVAVNVLNNPKFRIDRYTGAISISGKAGDYSGHCEPYDPEAAERKF